MIMRSFTLSLLVVLGTCTFVGCSAVPGSAPGSSPVPSGSAAFAGRDEPWQKDLVESVPPAYSHADRAAWREGRGVFHITVDRQSGRVRKVAVKQSTGHRTLDAAAVAALSRWRFRPGSWQELDVPVNFRMAKTHREYIERVRHDQQRLRRI
jgi:periplasmic protein TonB